MLNKKQLNKCQAWIYYDERNIADSNYIALVSYNTLICVWQHNGRVLCVGENYNCSNTTIRHFSAFLNHINVGISYNNVKYWFAKCFNGYTGEIINTKRYKENYGFDNLIYPSFHNSLYWRNQFSVWRLENAIAEGRLG